MKTVFSFLIYVVFISNTYALPQCEGDDETKWQNCEGTLKLWSGEFVGVFNDGIFVGETEFGVRYEGEYKNGTPHGQGTLDYSTGAKYVGEWKDGQPHGQGTFFYNSDGDDRYVGEWDRYEGEYRDGKKHGKGTLFYPNGDKIEGYWRDHKPFGPATFIFDGGDEIEGYFKDGEFVPK